VKPRARARYYPPADSPSPPFLIVGVFYSEVALQNQKPAPFWPSPSSVIHVALSVLTGVTGFFSRSMKAGKTGMGRGIVVRAPGGLRRRDGAALLVFTTVRPRLCHPAGSCEYLPLGSFLCCSNPPRPSRDEIMVLSSSHTLHLFTSPAPTRQHLCAARDTRCTRTHTASAMMRGRGSTGKPYK